MNVMMVSLSYSPSTTLKNKLTAPNNFKVISRMNSIFVNLDNEDTFVKLPKKKKPYEDNLKDQGKKKTKKDYSQARDRKRNYG